MIKKCDAKCDSKNGASYYLWLRNNIFYYRFELPKQNNKRRYKRISLRTGNFFEAREKIKQMTNKSDNWPFNEIREIYNRLKFGTVTEDITLFFMKSDKFLKNIIVPDIPVNNFTIRINFLRPASTLMYNLIAQRSNQTKMFFEIMLPNTT